MAKSKSVSVDEFEIFKTEVSTTQNRILDLLEQSLKPKADMPAVNQAIRDAKVSAAPEKEANPNSFLPPQYQTAFEKYFDPTDGFEARLTFPEMDEKGNEMGGITFTIIVPSKFSNTTDAHRKFYRTDTRTIALRPENIMRGIDKWCSKVARNLKYNKTLQTK